MKLRTISFLKQEIEKEESPNRLRLLKKLLRANQKALRKNEDVEELE